MKADEKKCPQCAEIIKKEAKVCKHCGFAYSAEDLAAEAAATAKNNRNTGIGCLVIVGALMALGMCSAEKGKPVDPAVEAAKTAEEKQKGFHCLSKWDGSSTQLVDALKAGLRDPDSFEHVETRITPVDKKGQHAVLMKYRAKNGFGGTNIESALGTVDNATCAATLLTSR